MEQFLRSEARDAPESGIVALVNHGRMSGADVMPLWVGEGDLPTPEFISRPAIRSLQAGETFYTWQRGIPELREALARYYTRHFGRAFQSQEFIVTGSGMQAIQLALQATAGAGDEVVYLAPGWPNISAAIGIAGGTAVPVPLEHSTDGWTLDISLIEAAITSRTKALFINTPSNPTGWTADRQTLNAILEIARRKGIWIIADEIYALYHYAPKRAPSFLDIMQPDDRIMFVNTFSKNWAMTGWRVGWMKIHPELQQTFENLVQYSTSGVPQFLQKGCVAALDEGDDFVESQVERAWQARDLVCRILSDTGRVRLSPPQGAFYLFFAVEGITDSMAAAFDMVEHAHVGLAPGSAFGPGGESFFRLCFNRRLDQLEPAAEKIAGWIRSRTP